MKKMDFIIGGLVCFIVAFVLFVCSIILQANETQTNTPMVLDMCGWVAFGLGWVLDIIGMMREN